MSTPASPSPPTESVRPRGRLLTTCGALLALALVSVAAKNQGPPIPRFAPVHFSNAKAAPAPKPLVAGRGEFIHGKVTITRNGVTRRLAGGEQVQVGDILSTGPKGAMTIEGSDHNVVELSANTKLRVGQWEYNVLHPKPVNPVWKFFNGIFVWTSGLIGKDKNTNIDTPVGSVGIRGTKFITRYDAKTHTTDIELISGSVAVKPKRSGTARTFTAPVRIRCTATSVTESPLTQRQYEATKAAAFPP